MILVAEDDPTIQKVLIGQLKRLGYQHAKVVGNGLDAINNSAESCIIFMDINMPQMDGLAATRQIRDMESKLGKTAVPIIAVTGISNRTTCLAEGMTDHLAKPVFIADLESALRRWLPSTCDCCTSPEVPA